MGRMSRSRGVRLAAALSMAALCASASVAAVKPPKPAPTLEERKAARAERERRRLQEDGGEVIRPGTMRGWVLFANGQTLVDQFEVEEARDYLWDTLNFNIKVEKSGRVTPATAAAELARSGANAGVFLTEDPSLPILLVAPEERWAIVNATKLAEGAKTPRYVEMRVKKEVVRAFVHLCGGAGSSYGGSLTGAVRKASDLDRFAEIDLPMDVLMRFNPYMKAIGVTPAERTAYLFALDEPWCPPPANEWQERTKRKWEADKAAAEKARPQKPASAD